MKTRNIRILAATILMLVAILVPRTAHALPDSWKGSRTKTVAGVTYRYRQRDKVAVVVKVRKNKTTIPARVKIGKRTYDVRAIWEGAIPRKCKEITIHADLDCCEDARLWRIKVRVTRRGMYRWLKSTGANVTLR